MDQKEKDCAYWIAVLLSGVVLGVVGGFVFGWLWKDGPTSSEATKLVDVFIALGTIGSAVTALLFGLNQKIKERKARRVRGQIVLGEFGARLRTAVLSARLLQGAYLMIDPRHHSEDIAKVLRRIEGHLENIIDLFDDAFLQGFGELWENQAAQLITQLSVLKLLRVEFSMFDFECRTNIARAEEKARENRQKVIRFLEACTYLEALLK